MTETADTAWYQETVIYGVDVRSFQDSNDDGVGDLRGLIQRLDYCAELGVETLWLLPFFRSPFRDNGYDVVDHCAIERSLGSDSDFERLVEEAHQRGLRLLIELVANHTSDEHPWFQSARSDRRSPYRDYYVWADEPPPRSAQPAPITPEVGEQSVWTHDRAADAWYYHRFRPFEPGLNHANPRVGDEMHEIMRHWLDRGVDGFRIDAVSHVVEQKGAQEVDAMSVLGGLADTASSSGTDVPLMGEADVDLQELARYFADGRGLNVLLGFLVAEHAFLALARGEAEPLAELLRTLPVPPPRCTWAQFLRNLDELDLERLSPAEREEVYRAFAPQASMRIYDRGIRRRLGPMLGGDQRRLRLAWSLLLGMPGVPLLVYGEELGMGDDLTLDGREAVRLPMPWTGARDIGFSQAEIGRWTRPPLLDGPFGARKVNVERQSRDPASLLRFVKRLIRVRRELPEIGRVNPHVVDVGSDAVLALAYEGRRRRVLVANNLGQSETALELPVLPGARVVLTDDETRAETAEDGAQTLAGSGFRWLVHER